jgi:sulfoxide reductase heme-binding subunit YedZ
MTDALWYLGRGTGVVSLILLTVAVALGVGSRAGRPLFGLPRFAVARVHRNTALLACVLLTAHIGSLLFDPYAQLTPFDLIVPFGASYRPLWIGFGTLALDLVGAVVVTSLLRHRIGVRTWRVLHWLTYALWPLAVLHGMFAGTDAGAPWFLATAVVCIGVVLAALVWRLGVSRPQLSWRRS